MTEAQRDTARPRFYMDAVLNKSLSEKEGRPIYVDKEMVEVRIPGDKLFSWVGEVEEQHKQRWPEHYAAFKRGEQRASVGTPLEHWPNPELHKSRVAELKACDILSVEELANVPDSTLPKLGMGARELREQARAYIAAAKDGAGNSAMAAELARLKEIVEKLTSGAPVEQPKEKSLEDCTDDELKAFIKQKTGQAPRGNVSRETLLKRVAELAEAA